LLEQARVSRGLPADPEALKRKAEIDKLRKRLQELEHPNRPQTQ
jgi:hypothetical protein